MGYNYYRDGTLLNPTAPAGATIALRGATPATTYPNLQATVVSNAGVESDKSDPVSATTLATPAPYPTMAQADKDAIDAIWAASPVSGGRTGGMISVAGPVCGVYEKAYGTNDGTNPMTTDMHFRVASLTKSFTAMAILMAVDKGLLSLDDTVDKYLSNVPNGNTITIRMLLMHRSGLFHDQTDANYIAKFYGDPTSAWGVMSSLLLIRRGAVLAPPDTQYSYTNSNYVILGLILARVNGRETKSVIENDICAPLGLTQTSYPVYPTVDLPVPFSHGYGPNLVGVISDWYRQNPDYLTASGCMVSTIGDMVKLGKGMRDGTLLSPASHELWKTTFNFIAEASPAGGPAYSYGLGMVRLKEWMGHDGSWNGYSTALTFHVPSGTIIAVMENAQTSGPPALTAWSTIMYNIANHFYPGSADEPNPAA